MRRGIDALRIGSILLAVGVTVVTVPALATLAAQREDTPWWYHGPVLALLLGGIGLAATGALGRRTTRLAARVHCSTVLVATWLLPEVTRASYAEDAAPWIHHYLPSAIAASVLVSTRWPVNLAMGWGLMLGDVWLKTTLWSVSRTQLVNDLMFEATVLAMGAAVLTSIALSQRELEHEATVTAERFLRARAGEQLGRRSARWDAMVHDDILAALETIALDPPEVDARALARSTIDGLGAGPPTGDVDHVTLRAAVLEAVLAELPTASTRCAATSDARRLPPEAAEALLTALTEALRNAAEHAYDEAGGEVSVRLDHTADRVVAVVTDAGRGFDRSRVAPTSFGVTLSIEGRLGAVGGLASVRSRPGRGTTVELCWPAGAVR